VINKLIPAKWRHMESLLPLIPVC